jgi:hypothetical protein
MPDSDFYKAFKGNMDAMGLPAPASLFGSLTVALASTSAIAGCIAKLGTSATLSEVMLTLPFVAGGAAAAAGIAEIATALGAVSAAFYLGACIGSLIAAAIDVYGPTIIGTLSSWLRRMNNVLEASVADFVDEQMYDYPDLAPMRQAFNQVRTLAGEYDEDTAYV